jgi:phospholipid/cholesterol/gamma-HCH transport system substrate-binding protein
MTVGDPVKFHGVDVGTVKTLALDPADARRVQVDVRLRKEAPVKTDTKASLKLKGITGVVYVELNGGAPNAQSLLAVTPEGQIPEIASEKSSLATVMDQLPKVIEQFSAIEKQTKKVMSDVGEVTERVKDSPVMKLFPAKEKTSSAPADKAAIPPKEKPGPKK